MLVNIDGQIPNLLGRVYLADHQPKAAAAEFRKVLARPEHDYEYALSLSWLGLARSLADQNSRDKSIEAYQHFLQLWNHANPDADDLIEATKELPKLQASN